MVNGRHRQQVDVEDSPRGGGTVVCAFVLIEHQPLVSSTMDDLAKHTR